MSTDTHTAAEKGCPKRPLRIAHIGGRGVGGIYGGIETFYEKAGPALVDRGHEVTIYCRPYFGTRDTVYKGLRTVHVPTIRSEKLDTLDTFVHSFLSVLHCVTQPFDVIHFHALGPSVFAWIPRIFRQGTVVTVHGLDWNRERWGRVNRSVLKVCEWTSIRFPSATTVCGRYLAKYFRDKYNRKAYFVPNGVDEGVRVEPRFLLESGIEPNNYVLYVGRLTKEKQCEQLIDAFLATETSAQLVLAGAGKPGDEWVERLLERQSDRVRFLGFVGPEITAELYSHASIFVLPSTHEGVSIAAMEAMSYANCILASDIEGNKELIEGCGHLFQAGDTDALATKLQALLDDPEECRKSGALAKARAAEFHWPAIAESLETLYESVRK